MRIYASNFRGYEEAYAEFAGNRCIVVLGENRDADYAASNASGKTTLALHLVSWALYGKYPGQRSADSVIREGEKSCSVDCEFHSRATGQHFKVVRSRGPNVLTFYVDGSQVSGDITSVQRAIEESIGVPYDVFHRVCVYTGDGSAFARLTDAAQKETLRTLFPVDFTEALSAAKIQHRFSEDAVLQARTRVQYITAECDKLKEDIQVQQAAQGTEEATNDLLEQWTAARNEYHNQLQAFASTREEWSKYFNQYQRYLDFENKQLEQLDLQISQRMRDITAMNDTTNRLTQLQQQLHAQITQANEYRCPTCNQGLPEATKTEVINKLRGEFESAAQSIQQTAAALQATTADLESLREAHTQGTQSVSFHNAQWKAARDEHARVEQHARALQQSYDQAQNMLDQIMHQRPGSSTLEVLVSNLEAKSRSLAEETQVLRNEEANVLEWAAAVKALGLKGIQHYAFASLCKPISDVANAVLQKFSENQLKVELLSEAEASNGKSSKAGLHVAASSTTGGHWYSELSRSEKARVDIAIFLSLFVLFLPRANIAPVLILDEVADAMDEIGKEDTIAVLQEFCETYGVTALITTNDASITTAVSDWYLCVKKDGVSSAERIHES